MKKRTMIIAIVAILLLIVLGNSVYVVQEISMPAWQSSPR